MKNLTACVVNDGDLDSVSDMFLKRDYNIKKTHTNYYQNSIVNAHIQVKRAIIEMSGCDLLVFTGGTDISANIYGQKPVPEAQKPDCLRDVFEMALWKEAVRLGLPIVGICRGAQLLNCLNGGELVQHNVKHLRSHSIALDGSSKRLYAPADHHQVMLPTLDAEVLASDIIDKDAEVVFYEATRSLCHQPHPEWASGQQGSLAYQDWFFETVDELVA